MKGCFIAATLVIAVFALIGFGGYTFYRFAAENMPNYAKPEAVYARYGAFIEDVSHSIEVSESKYDLAARLEKLDAPDELLYLTLVEESDFDEPNAEKLEVVKKLDASSTRYTIINGTGYGSIDDVPVIVIKLFVNRHAIEECFIYLRYQAAEPTETQRQIPSS